MSPPDAQDGPAPLVRNLFLLMAALYPVAAAAGFALTQRSNPFAVFEQTYTLVWMIIIPGVLILLTVVLAATGRAPGRRWRFALIVWIALVSYAHYTLIGIAAARF